MIALVSSRLTFKIALQSVLLIASMWLLGNCEDSSSPAPGTHSRASEAAETASVTGDPLETRKLHPSSHSESDNLFTRVPPEESGLLFVNPLDTNHPLRRLYAGAYAAGGIAIGDVNGDDLPDVYCASGPAQDRLLVQTSPMRFEDRSDSSGITGADDETDWETGVAMVDIDADGDLDLYVCRYDTPNALFLNDGEGHFEERAAEFGLDVRQASLMPSFCDYDGDGDLDLYILTYFYYREGGLPRDATFRAGDTLAVKSEYRKWVDIRPAGQSLTRKRYDLYPVGQRDILLRNNGPSAASGGVPRFEDVSGYVGDLGVDPGKGLSATWWDYNTDGRPDLYVCNDFQDPDHFYHNNGDGTFTDIIAEAMPHTCWFSMGSDVADFNQDGRLDLFVLDMAATSHFKQKTTMGDMSSKQLFMQTANPPQYMRNSLYLNTGTRHFQEAAFMAGLARSDWSWATKAGDFDNDGLMDVFITNGMARAFTNSDILQKITYSMRFGNTEWDLFKDEPPQVEANLAFRNRGDLQFEETGVPWGLAHQGMSYSAVQGDLDRDGDLDLIVANLDEPLHLYRNDSAEGNRLLIELRGREGAVSALGARVELRVSGRTLVRQANPYTGYLSSNDPVIPVGLGRADTVETLTVHWPGGTPQTFSDVQADQWIVLQEPPPASSSSPPPPEAGGPDGAEPMFSRSEATEIRHRERPYDDFARQPLLPNKLSQLGPGLAVGDVDENGIDDYFLGGAAGSPGQLVLRFTNHHSTISTGPFEADREAEDMGALFLDADGDGHLDLFVVSGGVECEPGAAVLHDRLYLGNGNGQFARSPDWLPAVFESGSAAAAADFDRDGDLDIFVGARSIPGQYPLTPSNQLLVNRDHQQFENAISDSLRQTGLVTGALWSDVDDDGWLDLLLAHEWGSIKLFRNHGGKLEESTDTRITGHTGWWNSIVSGDIDHDGDIDYAVMNAGPNTKYHASFDHPALLYYGDFEGDGHLRLVEAEYEETTLFPVRGRSCSSQAMPHLADKFDTFHDFALASLDQVFSAEKLASSHRFAATTLESGMLINDGTGKFTFRPLPRIAQLAPAFGATLTDLDGDGHLDLYLLQNFFGPQLETGRMDGGISQLLLGSEDGHFVPVPADESGLVVPGDATALAVLDLNEDRRPDLAVARNDDTLLQFTNRRETTRPWQSLRLAGQNAVGARIEVRTGERRHLTAEIAAGGGYLSQSPPQMLFTLPENRERDRTVARIRWANGSTSETILSEKVSSHRIESP